jgi:hypothetical protein
MIITAVQAARAVGTFSSPSHGSSWCRRTTVFGDASEDVGEPGLGIDVVEARVRRLAHDIMQKDSGTLSGEF